MKFRMEQCFSNNRGVLTNGKMGLMVEADTPLEAARKGMSILVSQGVRPWLSAPGSEALVREDQVCGPSHFFPVNDLFDPPQESKGMTPEETHSVTRTIRELGRAYLQANRADTEHAQSWQDPSHASTVCKPLGRAIAAIVGEEIAESFWNHGEVETMVSDYLSTFNS